VHLVRAFGRFWFDFIVGDDWRIAAGVVGALGLGALALRAGVSQGLLAVLVAAALVAIVLLSVLRARMS
jgi:ABC-type methionine transport system permease subunit